MQDRCQLRQEVLEEGGWSTSKHNGVWVQSEQSYTVSCYFWDLTSSGLASLNQVTIAKPLFRMTFHVVLSESGKFKDITTKNVTTQTNAISGPYRHHWICKLIALLSAVFSKVPTFFPSFFPCTMTPYNRLRSTYWSVQAFQNRAGNWIRQLFLHIVRWSKRE